MNAYDDFASIYDFARKCYRLGDYEKACNYYKSALDLTSPRNIQADSLYWEYSLCLYKNGDCAESLKMIQQGLSYYPDCGELYYIRGEIFYELGLLRQSRTNFSKCTAIKGIRSGCPSEERIVKHRAYWFLTAIAARQEKSDEVVHYLRLFVMEEPPFSALQKLCLLLLHLGIEIQTLINHLAEAFGISSPILNRLVLSIKEYEACMNTANQLGENSELKTEGNVALGQHAFNRGCFMEAKVRLERSLAQEVGNPNHHCILGIACSRLGIYEQALEYFLRAMALDPENLTYPCFAFEALAIQTTKVLVQRSNSLEESPVLINELLRLCTFKRKSMRLRQTMADQGDNGDGRGSIYGRFNILSIIDDISEEEIWNLNV